MMKNIVLLVLIWLSANVALAGIEVYEFSGADQEQQFYDLIDELRCPKCQNQNIADSNAPLARDLKKRVYSLVGEGKTNDEITGYLVERYGDFISYRPPFRPDTFLLWFGPALLMMLALSVVLLRVRAGRNKPQAMVNDDQRQRVQELLNSYGVSSGGDGDLSQQDDGHREG